MYVSVGVGSFMSMDSDSDGVIDEREGLAIGHALGHTGWWSSLLDHLSQQSSANSTAAATASGVSFAQYVDYLSGVTFAGVSPEAAQAELVHVLERLDEAVGRVARQPAVHAIQMTTTADAPQRPVLRASLSGRPLTTKPKATRVAAKEGARSMHMLSADAAATIVQKNVRMHQSQLRLKQDLEHEEDEEELREAIDLNPSNLPPAQAGGSRPASRHTASGSSKGSSRATSRPTSRAASRGSNRPGSRSSHTPPLKGA